MRSSIVLGLATLVGLAAALPQPPVGTPPNDLFTPDDKPDGFPVGNLTTRGYDDDCVECPPKPCDTCDHKRWKGCLYIECDDDCDTEDCCECIGLKPEKPYVPSDNHCRADL